jgi:DNA-binding LacI/PurR family transcriptional regulator
VRIADQIRRRATQAAPGTRLPNERELRRELGVSIPKLREALTLLQQEGTIERRHGSGTYVADPLKTRHVAIFSALDLTHPGMGPYHRTLAFHLRRFYRTRAVSAQLYLGSRSPGDVETTIACPELWHALAQRQICGVVVLTASHRRATIQRLVRELDVPVVGGGDWFPVRCSLPLESMYAAAVHHLVAGGCRRLAFLGWRDEALAGNGPLERALAREQPFLSQNGVTLLPDWVRMELFPTLPGAGWEELREIWLASSVKPDGLVICDDCLLPDAALAIRQLQIEVPRDLAIVAFTGRGVSPTVPFPMTRLEIDPEAVAATMGEMLLTLVRGEALATPVCTVDYRMIANNGIPAGGETPLPQGSELAPLAASLPNP